MIRLITILLLFAALGATDALATRPLPGRVVDADDRQPLPACSLAFSPLSGNQQATAKIVTDVDGCFSVPLADGRYIVKVSYVGYQDYTDTIAVPMSGGEYIIGLQPANTALREVTITATEAASHTSSSLINRDAMAHLQPTSFSDVLSLLPGGMSATPDMTRVNAITLRETGTIGATGSAVRSPNYDASSLGTLFLVDGTPLSNDANMQAVGSSDESSLNPVNRGVDMRSISTDNIESVEVVRGIPSAEYGNLSSGLVNIRRARKPTPLSARFKADEFSKLFFLGKGFQAAGQIFNIDLGYLDSKADPRDYLNNYKRVTFSARAAFEFSVGGQTTPATRINWNLSADYTGSFDNSKIDPDISRYRRDEYMSDYNKFVLSSDLTFTLPQISWLSSANLLTSFTYQVDKLRRIKDVAPSRAAIAPTSMEEGVHDGHYILEKYTSDFRCDGRPFDAFVKFKLTGSAFVGSLANSYKGGVEWSMSKNYGDGQVYNIEQPPSTSWPSRPRAYKTIPAMHTLSFYLENDANLQSSVGRFQLQTGLRSVELLHLDSRYYLSGKPYLDPRINATWHLPRIGNADLHLAGGWGIATRMPTISYLYPQEVYADFVQLNYYDTRNPQEYSKVNIRTYIDDATNYDLRPARNHKWEVRLGAALGSNKFSITYFNEKLNSGFRYEYFYRPYQFRSYDASAINGATLTAPPDLASLPYTDMQVLDGYQKVTNGSRIDKQGIEFQITTARFKPLATALTITGAWFHTTYTNSCRLQRTVTEVINGVAVSDRYVGIYDTDEGRVNDKFNTNFLFDTQIPRLGLIFSTTVECMWLTRTKAKAENWTPSAYISAADGLEHPYTDEAVEADPLLRYLVKKVNSEAERPLTIPVAVYLNFKATKTIGKYLKVALFVNRMIDYLPDYTSNGLTIRRSVDSYFGMELNFTL